ncbi:hypothetical protein ISS37_01570 [candidate division KSB1 bacterium]|nr:hypothetical protein [candidate division KSB1 bacterium]
MIKNSKRWRWVILGCLCFYGLAAYAQELSGPSRLFISPTAKVLRAMDVDLTAGSAFGVNMDGSFLHNIGIGLGNVAEVQITTSRLANNITAGSTSIPTSGFKMQLLPEELFGWEWFPIAAVFLQTTGGFNTNGWKGGWNGIVAAGDYLRANDEFAKNGIIHIGYDTRFTTLYGVVSEYLGPVGFHGGVSLTDVRVKGVNTQFYDWSTKEEPTERQQNLIGGFAGLTIDANPTTRYMFEVTLVPHLQYNVEDTLVDVKQIYLGLGGIRYFITDWLSTDTGIRYQSSFKGIADLEIRLSFNIFVPTKKVVQHVIQEVKRTRRERLSENKQN